MAIRVRKDGTMWCAAHTKPEAGDTYIDDGLHYQMSVEKGVIVALPMPDHIEHPEWWWTERAPDKANFGMARRAALQEGGGAPVDKSNNGDDRG